MINVRLFVIVVAILTTSCYSSSDQYGSEPPYNPPYGDYRYQAESIYYDGNQNEVHRKSSEEGGINFVSNNTNSINITPLYGWDYTLNISNYVGHSLADGSVAYSFSINVQSVYANSKEFNIQGLRSKKLYDSDGTTLIGTYDGIVIGDEIEFGYLSLDLSTGESTRTNITAEKL